MAIAHEWLDQRAGSEKTFEALAHAFPDADLFALTRNERVPFDLGGRQVQTSFLDVPVLRDRRAFLLPLMPAAWRALGRKERYDVVITSSHACAKGFRPGREVLHLCYCHTPMRYAWLPELDRRAPHGTRLLAGAETMLRRWDRKAAQWVDSFAANSKVVQRRIAEFYERDARVIYPPVDVEFFSPDNASREDFVLAVSRFIPYKRLDLAIAAAAEAQVRLVVVGGGPEELALRKLASDLHPGAVTFEVSPSQERLRALYRRARALIFPALEDFGIVAVEAQACGTPVVALAAGGTLDTVRHGETGVLVDDQTPAAFSRGLRSVLASPPRPEACTALAASFGRHRFVEEVQMWLKESLNGRIGTSRPAVQEYDAFAGKVDRI